MIRKRLAKLEQHYQRTMPAEHKSIVATYLAVDSDKAGTRALSNDNVLTFYGHTLKQAFVYREEWAGKQSNMIMLQAPAMDSGGCVLQVLAEKHGAL